MYAVMLAALNAYYSTLEQKYWALYIFAHEMHYRGDTGAYTPEHQAWYASLAQELGCQI